jgi:WhiB family redox-sensing transcriptional regulator
MVVEIFQCSVCELRFQSPSELDDHMAQEHPDFHWEPRSLEDSLLGAAHRRRHLSPRYPPDYKAAPLPVSNPKKSEAGESVDRLHPTGGNNEPWIDRAACAGLDPTLFFGFENETEEESQAREAKAKGICVGCPVADDCLEFALATNQRFGIWGGLDAGERASELRRRAARSRTSGRLQGGGER